jgi:hypothetical protein
MFLYFLGTALIPRQVLDILKCDGTIPMSPGAGRTRCNFPGAAVLEAVERLYTLHLSVDRMLADSTIKGWMTSYNVDHGFSSPSHVCRYLKSHYTACFGRQLYSVLHMTVVVILIYLFSVVVRTCDEMLNSEVCSLIFTTGIKIMENMSVQ